MSAPEQDRPGSLSFGREEAWVVHDALLARIERLREENEDADVGRERALLEAIEAGRERYDRDELQTLRKATVDYLGDAPVRDRPPGRSALATLNAALHVG